MTSVVAPAVTVAFAARGSSGGEPPALSSVLFACARQCGWTITAIDWETYPMSFGWAAITGAAGAGEVLVVRDTNVVALSGTRPAYRNLRFVDDRAFADAAAMCAADIQLLPAAALDAPLSSADRTWLMAPGQDVASNLAYWRPVTVGDVLFNWWD